MIQLVLSILLGTGLFALLYLVWSRDRMYPASGADALIQAQQAISTLKVGLLPGALITKVFAQEDFRFVASLSSPAVQSAFIKERKKLALFWIRQVRSQILSLRKFHLGQSRFYARLSPWTELSLAVSFSTLLAECRALQVIIFLRGPYGFPRLIGRTIAAASRVCGVSEKSIAFMAVPNSKISGTGGPENQAAL